PTLRGIPDVVATLVAVPLAALLLACAEGGVATLGAAAFGLGLITTLGVSAAYHAPTWRPRVLRLLQRLDHAAIFALIAGTYAPFCLATPWSQGPWILALVLGFSLLGILRIVLWPQAPRAIRALAYVSVGVVALPFVDGLYQAVGTEVLVWTCAGGAIYILGALVYIARWPNPSPRHFGYHEVFHLFVFAAAACHYAAVWQVVVAA
ncbi:MAG: hemolysin III, partial [Planctomycetota bacterium]